MPKADQAILKKFLSRRHPDYAGMLAHWVFCEATYNGGRDWFDGNIHKYVREGESEYKDRIKRAYRFNHTREVVDQIQKYIFKTPVSRNVDDVSSDVRDFWANSTLGGLTIDEFMWSAATESSVLGMPWIFVDSNKSGDIKTVADEKAAGVRCYAYIVPPQDIFDVGFDDNGQPVWVLVRERVRDDVDPIKASGIVSERYRLWTTTDWTVWQIVVKKDGRDVPVSVDELLSNKYTAADRSVRVVEAGHGEHSLKRLPCFKLPNVVGDWRYSAPALINDIAYLDKAVANYLSNLDAIIQDQTFSQLVMPGQAVLPGEDKYEQLQKLGTKRMFIYDGDSSTGPSYISPDPKQAGMIVTVINKIINEIYHTVGMGGERTKQDNAAGIDNSSGVAKAYDFERLNSLLVSKAKALQNAELEMLDLVNLWHGRKSNSRPSDPDAPVLVKYADTFDVRSLFDEFTVAERLQLIMAPDKLRQEQMKQVVDKLFPALKQGLKEAMLAEIDSSWPPEPPPLTITGTSSPQGLPAKGSQQSGGTSAGAKTPASKNAGTKSRQGQVTSETK